MTIATRIDPQSRDTGFMIVAAFRYCIGRHSYAPSLCCDWLRSHWHLLASDDQQSILRDIRRHIEAERLAAEIRAENGDGPTGWECDLRTWERMAEWIAAWRPTDPTPQKDRADG